MRPPPGLEECVRSREGYGVVTWAGPQKEDISGSGSLEVTGGDRGEKADVVAMATAEGREGAEEQRIEVK